MSSQPESSRARDQPESSSRARERRPWAALSSIAVVIGANDERARTLAPGDADLRLDLKTPLRASYLMLPERIVPDRREVDVDLPSDLRVLAACSSHLLVTAPLPRVYDHAAYFLADAHALTVARIRNVPLELCIRLGPQLIFVPGRSIGLIADPRHPGGFLVAQLQPKSTFRPQSLLCYATATDKWTLKELPSTPHDARWHDDGALSHDGRLWWIDTACGMLYCDPFDEADDPRLHFVPLPPNCNLPVMESRENRFIRCSQGKLRYVQIRIFDHYDLFTLVNPDGPVHWTRDYTVDFADIRGDPSYGAAGVPRGWEPKLALIDPNNASIVHFFQKTSLFAVDGEAKKVRDCKEYVVDSTLRRPKFQNSRYIHAWELPPSLQLPDDGDTSYYGGIRILASTDSSDQADAEAGDQADAEDEP